MSLLQLGSPCFSTRYIELLLPFIYTELADGLQEEHVTHIRFVVRSP